MKTGQIAIIAAGLFILLKMKEENRMFEYFDLSEFDSPDLPGSGKKMDINFIHTLDAIRKNVGFPLIISSGYRTPEHNEKVGGVLNSAHTKGKAADIREGNPDKQLKIALAAAKFGIKRIGFGNTFIHLDNDHSKSYQNTWAYGGKKPPYSLEDLKTLNNLN
jgi:hypothetical protein